MVEQLVRMNPFAIAFILCFPVLVIGIVIFLKLKFSKAFKQDNSILKLVINFILITSFIVWAATVGSLVKQSMQNFVPRGVVEEVQFKNRVNHVKDSVQGIKQ